MPPLGAGAGLGIVSALRRGASRGPSHPRCGWRGGRRAVGESQIDIGACPCDGEAAQGVIELRRAARSQEPHCGRQLPPRARQSAAPTSNPPRCRGMIPRTPAAARPWVRGPAAVARSRRPGAAQRQPAFLQRRLAISPRAQPRGARAAGPPALREVAPRAAAQLLSARRPPERGQASRAASRRAAPACAQARHPSSRAAAWTQRAALRARGRDLCKAADSPLGAPGAAPAEALSDGVTSLSRSGLRSGQLGGRHSARSRARRRTGGESRSRPPTTIWRRRPALPDAQHRA